MGWLVVFEKEAATWIWRGWFGTRRAAKSTRNGEVSTWILLVDGSALLAGSEDAKLHSSSSAEAGCRAGCGDGPGPPTKSSNDDEAGAAGLCVGGWNGLELARGLAETSDANGSTAGGGVAVDDAWGKDPMKGVGD